MMPATHGAHHAPLIRISLAALALAGTVGAVGARTSAGAPAAGAADSARFMAHDSTRYEVLVSATRRPTDAINIPNGAAVVSGEQLRRQGARTLADAIQDVVGLDTGDGSDNGPRLPNIGLWGLKEFDALLITLDGVPVGGPFNPSLTQIDVGDIDHIEVVKSPQGTLYGVSGFAGMVQVFSNHGESGVGHAAIGGGSFSDLNGDAAAGRTFGNGIEARASGLTQRSDGWQDRTRRAIDRASLSLTRSFGRARVGLDAFGYRDEQRWGSPMPYESGMPIPGFVTDRNYSVSGAHI